MRRNSTASRVRIFILTSFRITITNISTILANCCTQPIYGPQPSRPHCPELLRFHARPYRVELASRPELFVLVSDEIRVYLHENFPRRPEIELRRFIPEEFAM